MIKTETLASVILLTVVVGYIILENHRLRSQCRQRRYLLRPHLLRVMDTIGRINSVQNATEALVLVERGLAEIELLCTMAGGEQSLENITSVGVAGVVEALYEQQRLIHTHIYKKDEPESR